MTTTAQQMVRDAMRFPKMAEVGIQPSIIMSAFVDHSQVAEYTDCFVNEAHQEKLARLLADGWVMFRMQTEFDINCHVTKAYLAKMKDR